MRVPPSSLERVRSIDADSGGGPEVARIFGSDELLVGVKGEAADEAVKDGLSRAGGCRVGSAVHAGKAALELSDLGHIHRATSASTFVLRRESSTGEGRSQRGFVRT